MAVNLYGDITGRTAGYAAKKLLKRGQPILITERFGQIDPQGKNKTKTRKYRRYKPLAPATTPLAEGVTPKGSRIDFEDVQCTLEQYGDYVIITDVIQNTHEDPVLNEMMDVCGEQAAETIELVRLAILKAGSSVFYAGGVSSRSAVDATCDENTFSKIKRFFNNHRAKPISKIIRASVKYGTDPVAPAFFVLGHTDLEHDIKEMPSFTPVEKYSDSMKSIRGEIGKVGSFRFILTDLVNPWEDTGATNDGTYLTTSDSKNDVYPLICIADNAYGIVPFQGSKAVTPMVKNPSTTGDDPLAQRGHVAWKAWQTAIILQELYIVRLEVCATAL